MYWVVVPFTVRPSQSFPRTVPESSKVWVQPCGPMLSNCHFTGPTKLPAKRVTWVLFVPVNAFSHAPEPFTINDEPAPPAKVPPPRMLPLVRAPVEKLTEPRELPVLTGP